MAGWIHCIGRVSQDSVRDAYVQSFGGICLHPFSRAITLGLSIMLLRRDICFAECELAVCISMLPFFYS